MYFITLCTFVLSILCALCNTRLLHESHVNFRIEPGSKTCFYERGKAGHTIEVNYKVIDGQHGDVGISFDIIDPIGVKILSDHKKADNSIIMDLEVNGEYTFCMDNFSVMNSKLVFVSILIEAYDGDSEDGVEISIIDDDGTEHKEEEVFHWMGAYNNGEYYYIYVKDMAMSISHTLKQVIKARQLLVLYSALKSQDYLALEETIVDMWSISVIIFMILAGLLQVYTIKHLFNIRSI